MTPTTVFEGILPTGAVRQIIIDNRIYNHPEDFKNFGDLIHIWIIDKGGVGDHIYITKEVAKQLAETLGAICNETGLSLP